MSLAEVLDDRDVLDDAGDGVRVLKISLKVLLKISSRSNIRNLVMIAPILQVSSWSLVWQECSWWCWRWCQGTQNSLGSSSESFIKIQHQKPSQDCTYPASHFLESWRTWMFLMELEMVSGHSEYLWEVLLKVSSRYNIRNLVKTAPILEGTCWTLRVQDVHHGTGNGV